MTSAPVLSSRAREMPASSIRRLFNAALEVEKSGARVLKLHIGDPDIPTPPRVIEAVTSAMQRGQTKYSAMIGISPLRQSIARHLQQRFAISAAHFPPRAQHSVAVAGSDALEDSLMAHIVVNQGATQALNSAMQACCDSGDHVLLPQIYFPNYIQQVTLAGIRPLFYPLGDDFQPRLDLLEQCIAGQPRGSVKAMLINTPGNPTGALFPEGTVRALYAFARSHGLWIISDEAYCDYVFEGDYVSPLAIDLEYPEEERRVLAIFSFSKSYAVTGLRMGYSVSPREDVTARLALMNEPFTGSLTTPLQEGMTAALSVDDTSARRELLRPRWELAGALLREAGIPVQPTSGGIFYFVDISASGLSGDEFADRLLAEEHVAVVPGSGFGLVEQHDEQGQRSFVPNELALRCVRICFGVPEEDLREGIQRMGSLLARLRTARQA